MRSGSAATRPKIARSTALRSMKRSYRTARQPIHDHFRRARDFVALEAHAMDGLERVRTRGEPREPRREDDHVLRTRLLQVLDHSALPLATIGNDLGGHESHQVNDLAP